MKLRWPARPAAVMTSLWVVPVAGRATYVPHWADKSGIEWTTTVTDIWPVTWLPGALAA
jgi:hypothetical protein